jgi:hypothetical protein
MFFIALLTSIVHPTAGTAQLATIVSFEGTATILSQGQRTSIREGLPVEQGDVIETAADGHAMLNFFDDTRIAVGPLSRFEVTDIRLSSNGKASRFAVQAVRGTFRFLSGTSPKDAYSIRTPTATLGVRGTEFDFYVDRRIGSNVALFRGEVVLCPNGGSCALVRGRCTLALSDTRGNVGVAATRDEKKQILVRDFPFVVSQKNLPSSFRTSTSSCGNLRRVILETKPPVQQMAPPPVLAPSPSEPVRSPEPVRPPAPKAEEPRPEPSREFPGQSGTDTPNAGKGNDVSRGQDGTGTGNGRGVENRNTSNRGTFGSRTKERDNGKGGP